jgi:hypothetical protein
LKQAAKRTDRLLSAGHRSQVGRVQDVPDVHYHDLEPSGHALLMKERLEELLGLVGELSDQRDGLAFLKTVLTYLVAGAKRLDEDTVKQVVQKVFTDKEGCNDGDLSRKVDGTGLPKGVSSKVWSVPRRPLHARV